MDPARAALMIEESPPEMMPRRDHTEDSPLSRFLMPEVRSAVSNPSPGTLIEPIMPGETGEPELNGATAQLGENSSIGNNKSILFFMLTLTPFE